MPLQIVLLAAALFAHLFVLWTHTGKMLGAEHYQFFPLGLVAAWILWKQRQSSISGGSKPANVPAVLVLSILSIGLVAFATLMTSGFLGWLSLLFFLLVFVYACFGTAGLRSFVPVWLLLAALTPIPAGREQMLVVAMQHLASRLASTGLDAFGVLHFRQGVVISSADQQFLAEEACSGIRSLFSVMVGIFFWGLFHRYAWWRHALNFIQALLWVILFNAGRILMVVLVEEWTNFSVASGWKHELLGFIVFFLIGGTVLSTDALIRAFFPQKSTEDDEEQPSLARGESALAKPIGVGQAALTNVAGSKVAAAELQAATEPTGRSVFGPVSSELRRAFVALVAMYCIVGLLGLRTFMLAPQVASLTGELAPLSAGDLPPQLLEWKVGEFREIQRSREDLQGNQSYTWRVSRDRADAVLSTDGDFEDYHDLRICYSALGWKFLDKPMYPSMRGKVQSETENKSPECTLLYLEKLTGEKGILFFCSLDRTGASVFPQNYLTNEPVYYTLEKVTNQLRLIFGLAPNAGIRETTFIPPVSTLQLLYTPKDNTQEISEQELQRLFVEFREQMRQTKRFSDSQ